jgi:hypothetical protein
MSTKFKVVRGTEERIQEYPYVDGHVYFAIDSGRMYLDTQGDRVPVGGGNGVVIHYGRIPADLEPESLNTYSVTYPDMFENQKTTPQIGDLILNSDGSFLRITDFDGENIYKCVKVLVSGVGGGGGSTGGGDISIGQAMQLTLTRGTPASTVLNGQSVPVTIKAVSAKDTNGVELDQEIYLTYTISTYENNQIGTQYRSGALNDLISGESMTYDFGPELRPDAQSIIIVSALSNSVEKAKTARMIITSSNLELTNAANFSNLNVFYTNEKVTLMCNAIGNMNKILEFSFDGKVIATDYIGVDGAQERQYSIPANHELLTHGVHTIKYELFQDVNANSHEKGLSVPPIEVEIAVVDRVNTKPIIWLGNYKQEYKTYDDIQIPFKVYNGGSTAATVYFLKNNQQFSSRNITIGSQFEIFEIADAMENATNYYAIACGEQDNRVARDIVFTVVEDKEHVMVNPQLSSLKLGFDARGRSNDESEVQRKNWVDPYCEKAGVFEGFNWYNNGWVMDNYQTCLRISNGASFKIPFGEMVFNGGAATNTSNSFDFQFKIRNVKDYSSLIKTVTRYVDDGVFYNEWFANWQKRYPSYDSYLTVTLPKANDKGVVVSYDDLVFLKTEKLISLDNMVCGFFDGDSSALKGLCIGPQDAFFSNGTNTVSANFVENQMVYLTFVYDGTKKNANGDLTPMMYIYLNGVLTGVVRTTLSSRFAIGDGNPDKCIEFSSNSCDIDLYKVRFYNTALSVNDVVMNYAIDNKDITTYDQNGLAEYVQNIQEYRLNYKNVLNYNKTHANKPLMPYVIFDTSKSNNNDRLSFSKKYKVNIGMEFVNTALDLAFQNGELEDLAIKEILGGVVPGNTVAEKAAAKEEAVRTYYLHHCPSFITESSEMAVQGTSSEFYPRRNYKVKMKTELDEDKVERTHFWITGGPYATDFATHGTKRNVDEEVVDGDGKVLVEKYKNPCHTDWFYMNNYTNGTNRFTMKVDYMESSGSYNMGLANIVYNAYSKHPLEDYLKAPAPDGTTGLFTNTNKLNSKLGSLRWADYRTSVQGFPVMAFHKKSNGDVQYIGLYRMLLDKGSDECYGLKPDKTITNKLFPKKFNEDGTVKEYERVRDIAECWEFSDNNRGFCSFRDPWNREELSFRSPNLTDSGMLTANLAPVVADSFEYRYSQYEDALDVIYEIGPSGEFNAPAVTKDAAGKYTDKRTAALRDAFGDDFDVSSLESIHEGLYTAMSNYERVCAWVWATNIENAISGGTYAEIALGTTVYEPGTYYLASENAETGEIEYTVSNDAFDITKAYFEKSQKTVDGALKDVYEPIKLVDADHIYEAKKYYTKSTLDDSYVLATGAFDSAETYYVFAPLTSEEIEAKIAAKEALHTKKLTDRYPADRFPGYLTEEGYATWDTKKKYLYDTQEFRSEKFTNELAQHFDIEYLAAYFIITEVLECYDSRGKNCMMASWGPQAAGGDYIWYPIFYDMDTQLGINNTGIPSFDYNVDVTEEGCFSTSDSILWNNFYKNYKTSYILDKYRHLKGENIEGWGTLTNPVFNSVAKIEAWYSADPVECNNITMRGERPLIVKNLDEYYKYITITNNTGLASDLTSGILNTTGYQSSGTEGEYIFDDNGTYFYALQGDRSLSRQQFLTNRFEYIDSWLNQGNYQRGGQNRIRGRVSANYKNNKTGEWYTSDKWMESTHGDYWVDKKEFGTKSHDFDAQYWLTLQPVRNTYVTIGGDANSTYPSQKYSGTPINYKIQEMEAAVRDSNLAEKLLYVYGMNQMASAGDLYKNYWTEFYLEGKADKLSSLLLGCDGLMYNADGELFVDDEGDTPVKYITDAKGNRKLVRADSSDESALKAHRWFNNKINLPTMPPDGLPLLEEANFSNLQVQVTDPTLKMNKSEKLQVFRATNSNFAQIDFAPGVSLHTLYLPNSITRIDLKQAKLLNNIVTEYAFPQKVDGNYVADRGLYVEGLTDWKANDPQTRVSYLNLEGSNMGFDSYKLLDLFYQARNKTQNDTQIKITDVQWTPYRRLVKGDTYDEDAMKAGRYFIDNDHYGYTQLDSDYEVTTHFDNDITNGVLYILDENFSEDTYMIKDIEMFKKFIASNYFISTDGAVKCPDIRGDMYVHNADPVEETYIRNTLNVNFPDLNITFKTVTPSNSMKFIVPDLEDETNRYLGTYAYVPLRNGSKEKSVQKRTDLKFENPYKKYNPSEAKQNYDFIAWSSSLDVDDESSYIGREGQTEGENQAAWEAYIAKIEKEAADDIAAGKEPKKDYTIYALFVKHKYEVQFYNGTEMVSSTRVTYNECLEGNMPDLMLIHPDEDNLDIYKAYKFLGFSRNDKNMVVTKESDAQLVDYSMLFSVTDYKFYAVYMMVDVHDTVISNDLLEWYDETYVDPVDPTKYNISGVVVSPKSSSIAGKITLPTEIDGKKVIGITGFNGSGVTAIFWNSPDGDNPYLRMVRTSAFQVTPLKFFEFTSGLRTIAQSAFYTQNNAIEDVRCIELLGESPLYKIDADAFNSAFGFKNIAEFKLRGTVQEIASHAFLFGQNGNNVIAVLKIGTPDEPSTLKSCGNADYAGIRPSDTSYSSFITKATIYKTAGFNDAIVDQQAPHIYGVGSWDVQSI